jgi:epoxyqueuosine reductase
MQIKELKEYLLTLGVEVIGFAPLEEEQAWLKPHQDYLSKWISDGKHADMDWLAQKATERLLPKLLLPSAKNAIILWMNHYFDKPTALSYETGKVARYAWGRDYHQILRRIVEKTKGMLLQKYPEAEFFASIDSGPVLERAFAQRGHIGWIGKSMMLIHPHQGTYGSLAVIFTNLALNDATYQPGNHKNHCGTCRRCIDECPTQALSIDQGLDARRCISYWTIEARTVIPLEIRRAMKDLAFGCDICQDVCPWNRKAKIGKAELWQPKIEHIYPNLKAWLMMSDEALNQKLFGSPLRRAHPFGLKRNFLIVIANQKYLNCLDAVYHCLNHEHPVVRATALWTAVELGEREKLIAMSHPILMDQAQELQEMRLELQLSSANTL